MANTKSSHNRPDRLLPQQNPAGIKETLKEVKKDPAVKEALKKEKQPRGIDDLSPLHNTTEIGTSGGDQRAREAEPNSK